MNARIPVIAGCLVRGRLKRALVIAAAEIGIRLDIEEEKGIFESALVLNIVGDEEDLERFQSYLIQIKKLNP